MATADREDDAADLDDKKRMTLELLEGITELRRWNAVVETAATEWAVLFRAIAAGQPMTPKVAADLAATCELIAEKLAKNGDGLERLRRKAANAITTNGGPVEEDLASDAKRRLM
jgi:hypothetical protein